MISVFGSITWYEPPPIVNETDSTVISVADGTQLLRGVDGLLSWNFSLTGEQFTIVYLTWKTVNVVTIDTAFGVASVIQGFNDRFNLTWSNSQRATLVIFNVSTEYEGDFSCKVFSFDGRLTKSWIRKIQVAVIGKQSTRSSQSIKIGIDKNRQQSSDFYRLLTEIGENR